MRRWQYSSKNCVWEEIQSCAAAVDKDTIKTLTDSMNNRLIKVMGAKGGYIHYITIRLLALDFYAMIVDEGEARINYHRIEIESE